MNSILLQLCGVLIICPLWTCSGRPWWINWVNGEPPPKKTLICSIACPTMFNRNIFYVYNIDLLETRVFFPPHDSKTSRTFQEVWFLAQFDQVFSHKKNNQRFGAAEDFRGLLAFGAALKVNALKSLGPRDPIGRQKGKNRSILPGKTWQNPWQNNPRVNSQKDVSNCGCPAGSCDLLKMVGKLHIRVNVYSLKKGRPSIKFGFNQWDVTSSKHGDAPKKEGSKKT